MNCNKEIAETFDRVCRLEGVESYHGEMSVFVAVM